MAETQSSDTDRIRALERGLDVVEFLSKRGQVTLAELRKATGLSNATLLRVLATLRHRGWVRRNIVEGRYELSHSLGHILGEQARAHPLAELAAPILLDLDARKAGWPSDLCAVLEPGRIEIIESTRLRGPMAPTRSSLGIRPSMVFSAHGRTVLAFSEPEVRQVHLDRIAQYGNKHELLAVENGRLDEEIAKSRARGFGLREPNYWAPPFDPGPEVGAMAVPIISKSGLHGTLSILWLTDDTTLEALLDFGCLEDLRSAAVRIAATLDREGITPPAVLPAD
ncbi:MAG: helix-turn-helix domain-containing protein [Shimia sp.]|uniref:helix-turn-helix domain-containing protein n=1 Tax=Shimia sp. TaxID=1954381 RepID=UPI004058C87D